MNYVELSLKKFEKLPEEIRSVLNSDNVSNFLNEIESKLGVDLSFTIVLIFINELDIDDLELYLKNRFSLKDDDVKYIISGLEDNVFKVLFNFLNSKSGETNIFNSSIEEKRFFIQDIFSNQILSQFSFSEESLLQLNAIIFEIISQDESFIEKIKRLFLDSKELLSSKKITVKGKLEDASISSWIKDFIAENGSDIFSPVVLAKYLTSSKNVSLLDNNEKQLLRQILKMYRNLFFFPESMGGAKYEDWEIFPINKDLLQINLKDIEKNNITPVAEEKPVYQPINTHEEEIKVLKELLQKYPNKSLEKKAIESEIKKIEEK